MFRAIKSRTSFFSNTDDFSFARRTSVVEPYTPVSYISLSISLSLSLSLFGPFVATLVTVWRFDFLLNSASKKLRIRSDSLFPHLLIPRDSRGGPDCASPATTALRLGKIPLNFRGIHVRPTDRKILRKMMAVEL